MIRRLFPLALLILLVLPLATVASAQSNGAPTLALTNQYIVNGYGFVTVNETMVFQNNGTSSVQLPSFQIGVPDSVASHSSGWVLQSAVQFTQTSVDNGNVTTFTVTPGSESLAAGASVSVSLKAVLSGVFNITAGESGTLVAPFLLSPSLNTKVTNFDSEIVVPNGGVIGPVPGGFLLETATLTTGPAIYSNTTQAVTPSVSTGNETFTDASQTAWEPIQVYSVVVTIVPSANASPQVQDTVSLRNLANYSISSLPLSLLVPGLTEITAVPTAATLTIDPTLVNITGGALQVNQFPYMNPIQPGDNFTFGVIYALPNSDIAVSGATVSASIPYVLPLQAVVQNYTVRLGTASGINAVGPSSIYTSGATPVALGSVVIKYSVNLGWGASQAVPIASLVFAAAFIVLGFGGRTKAVTEEEEEEEGEELSDRLADMIKAFEDKIALFQQFESDMEKKSQGTVPRAEFNKVKNEIDSLKNKANGRLNALRQSAGSQRYQDLLGQLQEASREEDRGAKDLLNLYDQYQSKRMREETFKRLLPNYKKRLASAVNHLSDLLNLAQREGRQA